MTKFIARLRHSMFLRLAILAVISRPNRLTVMLSPSPTPIPRATAASNDISGGPA